MKRVIIFAIAWSACVAAAYSQTPPDSTQSFAAASVKALKTVEGPVHFTVLPNRLDVANLSLGYLIKQAYDLRDDQLSGPDWLSKNHYDIAATSGDAASPAVMRVMLQHLLVERFHLATHWETRTVAMYRLVVLPSGPKMKVADHGFAMANSPMMSGGSIQLNGPMSMPQLAQRLTRHAGKPVVDATNLEGFFTIALTFASDDWASTPDNGLAPPLLTVAVQEQLGVKLVPESGPVKILVVDHADPVPTDN
jgi:uncharacterized protein (TIGR03435 family)